MRYDFPNILPAVIDRIWQKITMAWYRFRSPILAWLWGVGHGKNLLFQGKSIIRTRRKKEIVVGNDVVFNSDITTNLVGLINPGVSIKTN